MKLLLVYTITLVGLLFGCYTVEAQQMKDRPNVLVIYTDDLGYGDLSLLWGHQTANSEY